MYCVESNGKLKLITSYWVSLIWK